MTAPTTTIPAAAIVEIASALEDACALTSFRGRSPDDELWRRFIRACALVRAHFVDRLGPLPVAVHPVDTDSLG